MKSNFKALPYPVLGRSDDFVESAFQTTVDFDKQTIDDIDHVRLRYDFRLSNEEISGLISSGSASYAIDISCTDTLYRQVLFCPEGFGELTFLPGELYGKVTLEPMVIITKTVSNFSAKDLNPEYRGIQFKLEAGDTIAIDETITRFIEFDKLRFESLVRIQTSDDVPSEIYRFELDTNIITILMGRNFRAVWDIYREERDKAPFLAMSVYKDCILAALHSLSHNDGEDQFKWARALEVKLSAMGIRVNREAEIDELNVIAQQLVSKLSVKRLLKHA